MTMRMTPKMMSILPMDGIIPPVALLLAEYASAVLLAVHAELLRFLDAFRQPVRKSR
jgi:hypothetical protein